MKKHVSVGNRPKKVDRGFMLALAKRIYDGRTRRYLRLCTGTLTNGPDPKDAGRSMHCGLGELYFAMTGKHAHGLSKDHPRVTETDVVELAVKMSDLREDRERRLDGAVKAINALGLPPAVRDHVVEALIDFDDDDDADVEDAARGLALPEARFREELMAIPDDNDGCADDGDEPGVCSADAYRERARLVAKRLRAAAEHLPG